MNFDLYSFLLGGAAFLIGFLVLMAWLVPDRAASTAMTWLTARRNFSLIGLGIGIVAIVAVLSIVAIALVKLLRYVQVEPWVLWVAAAGLAFAVISIVTLMVTKQRNVS
ncbi:hypothetical protein A2434_01560 [Candidatus Woesebacteria bacterium RIFOXYC1_FULL_41_14]|uniref:Uncharacterized protein n=4 Tax=Candidatus Woeseibacteriota TaxID=1752722 RepID=A0A0G0ZVF6_9BACT|nr:MAG: hypothetical protein UU39_C0027G0005 [Candidatus Woesebacteria bacterium GW2011_GWD1_41_12]KKS03792.1 MAG: hypothetical protein UU57_C0029G0007 [Candidatus Woesebacteria bacterium GW2011_GWE1_41_24]KKS17073.1 MAG: hypothetical protein UU74_C0028G0005 [Candidatus Woesebacteria bacterium GW2011_GWA1_41_7]OGM81822.1 MAG: hypothetical protein A2393_00450 [Candidatus Woesebacteria bacterium RIFOXYB1_FULL_41_13]OGM83440.1 MAG: hypothetical protein A2434_01560 [Candidatus Woesebacteria bacteri